MFHNLLMVCLYTWTSMILRKNDGFFYSVNIPQNYTRATCIKITQIVSKSSVLSLQTAFRYFHIFAKGRPSSDSARYNATCFNAKLSAILI